jgi:OOP family OmpA-OmpF porin
MRSNTMRSNRYTLQRLLALAFVLALTSAAQVFAKNPTPTRPQDNATTRPVASGERVRKFKGIVVRRGADSFTMSESMGGPQTVVLLTPETQVKSHKKGVLRGSKDYAEAHILRGLRLEVDGTGNAEGQLVAERIRFDEQDLRTAQSLRSTVDPVEADLREQLRQQQLNQERLASQLEETQAVVQTVRGEAAAAQSRADSAHSAAEKALLDADRANNRINGLDDFDPIKIISVNFRTGSSVLGPKAKADIDEAAAWVKTQNTNGWVVAVVGFADSTGNTARNRALSEKRAQNVLYYLVTNHRLPLQHLVEPFGYGELEPTADNTTREGRAKNRRTEIRLMVNKGIAGTTSTQ